jgi:hypothetical protein
LVRSSHRAQTRAPAKPKIACASRTAAKAGKKIAIADTKTTKALVDAQQRVQEAKAKLLAGSANTTATTKIVTMPGEWTPESVGRRDLIKVSFASGCVYLIRGLQRLSGLLLLSGFFVPLALAVLSPSARLLRN